MPVYLFWGDDDAAVTRAARELRDRVVAPEWRAFNAETFDGTAAAAIADAIAAALTPPFGCGDRLVWLANTDICQRCPDDLLADLERTLPQLPATTVLLLTSPKKPDGRLKVTKLLRRHAEVREFALIPPWKTDQLLERARGDARALDLDLPEPALERLVAAVGNDTRQLARELEKLCLYSRDCPLTVAAIDSLVTATSQTSFQLADAIRTADTSRALALVAELLARNEPPLRLVAALVSRFRTWLRVALAVQTGARDDSVARTAEIGNPKRVYFLKREVRDLRPDQLQTALALLLDLDLALKRGGDPLSTLQISTIALCRTCSRIPAAE